MSQCVDSTPPSLPGGVVHVDPVHLTDKACVVHNASSPWRCESVALLKAVAPEQLGAPSTAAALAIPRIVHQTWKTCIPPTTQDFYRRECVRTHPGWKFYLWTDRGNQQLVSKYFPSFLPTYNSYKKNIMRVDAVRLLYLYAYGGAYVDVDMACLRTLDSLVAPVQRDQFIVADANSDGPPSRGIQIPNAFYAAPPRHPFTAFLISRLPAVGRATTSVFATAGGTFITAGYHAWINAGGRGVTLLSRNSVYSDSNSTLRARCGDPMTRDALDRCADAVPDAVLYSLSAETWCKFCPRTRERRRAHQSDNDCNFMKGIGSSCVKGAVHGAVKASAIVLPKMKQPTHQRAVHQRTVSTEHPKTFAHRGRQLRQGIRRPLGKVASTEAQAPHAANASDLRIAPPGEACRRAGRHVLMDGRGACVLIATAVDSRSPRTPKLLELSRALCTTHGWFRVLINLYDANATRPEPQALHPCVSITILRGFKPLMWKHVLTPNNVPDGAYSHVWLLDSDMNVHPEHFDAITFLRLAEATNVSIFSPAVYGSGSGRKHMAGYLSGRCFKSGKCERNCIQDPVRMCAVCREPSAEVKAPLFKGIAWSRLHSRLWNKMPDKLLKTDVWVDLYWCSILDHIDHGCNPTDQSASCHPSTGAACAYSYVTPMEHMNDRTPYINRQGFPSPLRYAMKEYLKANWPNYLLMPSYRPANTLLDTQSCWSIQTLKRTSFQLKGWKLPLDFESKWPGGNSTELANARAGRLKYLNPKK